MWTIATSTGQRVEGILREQDARRAVHMLGLTQAIGPYAWQVVNNQGHRFVAEI